VVEVILTPDRRITSVKLLPQGHEEFVPKTLREALDSLALLLPPALGG